MGNTPWGAPLVFWGVPVESRDYIFCVLFFNRSNNQMNAHLKAYLWFIGFTLATKIIVAPVAKSMNIPYVQDL